MLAQLSDDSGEDFGMSAVDPKESTQDDILSTQVESQTTSRTKALDIAHFFKLVTKDNGEMKRVCNPCQ
jgi:hypothetical protein